ncbi:transcriptional regulator, MerR family [Paenibacillus curdlanolyticus YK9]|uniref:Transcriptional regulator, MerR family n=1 Tax=Paenibacillus curdlanolyticus YK9 TaxID=717606 RepID=E0I9F5_9BACL|nr:MerR family transcriptional regulator [Paenibacillus curdlanolyticus]EFM11039.1 transcriptional regulator, MerR family [Paenibacillus curdlanolyticus YK9]
MSEPLTFSIKETATQSGLTEDTIRYYEKIGLLPRAKRKQNSHRIYHLDDVETMRMIACFKKTGMSLESMKPYLQLSQGDDLRAYPELFALMEEHKKTIENQIASLQQIVDFLALKLKPGVTHIDNAPCALAEPEKRPPAARQH